MQTNYHQIFSNFLKIIFYSCQFGQSTGQLSGRSRLLAQRSARDGGTDIPPIHPLQEGWVLLTLHCLRIIISPHIPFQRFAKCWQTIRLYISVKFKIFRQKRTPSIRWIFWNINHYRRSFSLVNWIHTIRTRLYLSKKGKLPTFHIASQGRRLN